MSKVITISDFNGGWVNFPDQTVLAPNQCASGSQNVWAPEGSLIGAPGWTLQASFTASGFGSFPWFGFDDTVSTSLGLFYRIAVSATGDGGTIRYFPFGSSIVYTDALTPLGYTTGTVSISGGSLISATGSGTTWLTHVTANDRFNVTGSNSWYNVSSVEDNTHLTLSAAVSGAVATGTGYTIQPGLKFLEIAAAALNGSLCWVTTGDNLQRYDGTGLTRISSAPNAAYLTVFKNYMFAARTNTAQSRLYWSAIKDPTSWPVNNFVDVDVLYGKITGIFSFGTELIVFKNRGMYKVIGDVFDPSNPQYYVLKINTPPDFMFNSNYSAAIHRGNLIFYGGGRIYQYALGAYSITDISRAIIRSLPNSFNTFGDSMANIDQRVQGFSFNDYYLLKGFADPNNNNSPMLILDRNGAWWWFNNTNATTTVDIFSNGRMTVVPSTSARPQLAIGTFTYPKVFTIDFVGPSFGTNFFDTSTLTGASTAVAINKKWVSKEFNIDYGTFLWLIVYLKKQSAGNLTVQWSIDQGSSVSTNIDMTAGRGQVIRSVLPINQKGSTIQLTLSNNTASQAFKVYGIKIVYDESPLERLA